MRTPAATLERARSRWQHYLMIARWKRADRIKRLLAKLEHRQQQPTLPLRRSA